MTDEQKEWRQLMSQMSGMGPVRSPPPPSNGCRKMLYNVVVSPYLEPFVLLVILFNTVLIALDDYEVSPAEQLWLPRLNLFCTCTFIVEATMKLGALGCYEYFKNGWNKFDFAVVTVALPDLFEAFGFANVASGAPISPTLLRILRIVRVARVLRLIKSSKGLRSLLTALLLSLPAMANLSGIFLIVMFLYTVLGMQLFGHIKFGDYLNEDANFCTFGIAFLTMFRCATGESWNGIMHDCMVTPATHPDAIGCNPDGSDCGSPIAVPFFLSYTVLASFVVLNMMIAVVLENFSLSRAANDYRLSPEGAEAFTVAWANYDPYAQGFIDIKKVPALLKELPEPLCVNYLPLPDESDAFLERGGAVGREPVSVAQLLGT